MTEHSVLVIEDEGSIASFLQTSLERDGYRVSLAATGEEGLSIISEHQPDLVILDLMLPGMDGLEVCRKIRGGDDYLPVIILTAKDAPVEKIVGLEIGADDYVTKPFHGRELLARVRAVLRLAHIGELAGQQSKQLQIDDRLEIDLRGRVVKVLGKEVGLTPKEFDLLVLMASQRGKVFGRETLLEKVWGYEYLGDSRTVDVHVQRLRGKIEENASKPQYILTVRTIGYKFA